MGLNDSPIRVLAVMEASWVMGPAKNLIEFAQRARVKENGRKVEIAIATFDRGGNTDIFVQTARAAAIPVFPIKELRRFDTAVMTGFRKVVETYAPDILQSHNIKAHLFVRMLKLNRKYPWIAFNHGYTNTDLKDRLYNQLDRWSLRAADRVVAVCEPFARALEQRGIHPSRLRIQQNAIKPFARPSESQTEAVRSQLVLDENTKVVLVVGRLSNEKGHRDLLQAVALLEKRENLPAYRVVIVGDGAERSTLETLTERLTLTHSLTFAGHQSNMGPYYALADVLALPSHSEGSPNVVLEAMAAGVPVVATMVGGVAEMLEGDAGLMVPSRDPAEMAGALHRVLTNPELRRQLATAALARIASRFTPEAYCDSVGRLYEEVLAERNNTKPSRLGEVEPNSE